MLGDLGSSNPRSDHFLQPIKAFRNPCLIVTVFFVSAMYHATTLSLLGSMAIGLADAAAVSIPKSAPANLFKRWNSKLCTCDFAGVRIPDSVTFQLPLENYRQTLCYDLINPSTSTPAGQFCWDFSANSDALTLKFKPATGIQFQAAQVGLTITEPQAPIPTAYTTDNGKCALDTSTGEINCSILWTEISGETALRAVVDKMCPSDDGRIMYMNIKVDTVADSQSCTAVPRPCDASNPIYATCVPTLPYFELSYRCTACPTCPDVPPVTKYCDFGTAFGYSPTLSKTLDTLSGTGCKRWGWYEQVAYGSLNGVSGTLYVGAGLNDLSKATSVGTWTASVSGGKVSVTYNVNPGYSLGEVHVDVRCALPTKCAPGQYTYGNTFANGVTTSSFTTTPIAIPCASGDVDIIVHAAVDSVVSVPANQADTYTCPTAKNTS